MLAEIVVLIMYVATISPLLLIVSPWLPAMAIKGLAALASMHMGYIFILYGCWLEDFAKRFKRADCDSPSNPGLPSPRPRGWALNPLLEWNKRRADPAVENDKTASMADEKQGRVCNQLRDRRGIAPAIMQGSDVSDSKEAEEGVVHRSSDVPAVQRSLLRADPIRRFSISAASDQLAGGRSLELDMDHVYLPFRTYVWGEYAIRIPLIALAVSGISKLMVRQRLHNMGLILPGPHNASSVVAELLLEGIGSVVHYTHCVTCERMQRDCELVLDAADSEKSGFSTDDDEDDAVDSEGEPSASRCIAVFDFHDFPILDNSANFQIKTLLRIYVDLKTRLMWRAFLDDEELATPQAMILVFWYTISAGHVKIHAHANWGVNVESKRNSFLRQSGLITVLYNYFGKTGFPRLCKFLFACRMTQYDFRTGMAEVFGHGINQGIHAHKNVRQLAGYSDIVRFVGKTRNKFLNLFEEHKQRFMGVDGEAMFVGTVLHSLDHTLAEWNLADALWLDTRCTSFGLMAEIGRFVRVAFVEDIPLLTVTKSFKDAPDKFYKDFYAHAARINQRFADRLDTCIVK